MFHRLRFLPVLLLGLVSFSPAQGEILGHYYFAGGSQPGFGALAATRVDGNINFNWGTGDPGIGGLGADGFAISWRGRITIPNEGVWTFYTAADDGSRIWIDGQLILNNWIDQGPNEVSGQKFLTAGTHDITVDYYENGGGASIQVLYEGPGVGKQIIPASALSLPRTEDPGILGRYTGIVGAPNSVDLPNFTDPFGTRIDANINSGFAFDPILGGVADPDFFGVRWTGKIFIPTTGNWTLSTSSDDGARLFIDENGDGNYNLIINQWVPQGETQHSATRFLGAGFYNIIMEYFENAGGQVARLRWQGPGVVDQVVPPSALFTHNRGLIAEFFPNTNLSGVPLVIRNDDQVNFDWGLGAPQDRIGVDNFSGRWRGKIQVPTTGTYTFFVASDDGTDLYVNNQLLVNRFGQPQGITEHSGNIVLEAGRRYYIDLRYVELTGGAAVFLRWQGPGIPKQIIPRDVLFPILNEAPTDITLSSNTVGDNDGTNTVVGLLSAVDPDNTTGASPLQSHSFALVNGPGDTHNGAFNLNGPELRINNPLSAGSYSIRVRTTDNGVIPDNLSFERSLSIVVEDRTPPVISLTGNATMTIQCGTSWVDPGYSATDNVDGNITANVVLSGQTVNSAVPNVYVVRYNVSDAAGNTAVERTRTVTVEDTTPPLISLNGAPVVNVECGATYSDAGATASDTCAGTLTGAISVSGLPINTSVPGSYTVTYNVSDPAGNPATPVTRTVNVADTTNPVVTRNGDEFVSVECGASFSDPGATALDACDGVLSVTTTGGPVNTSAPTSVVLTYSATDATGNTGSTTRAVFVVDTTAPTLTLNGASVVNIECGNSYNELGASASDSCEGNISGQVVISGDTVDTSSPGSYTVLYNVSDSAGNPATQISRTVVVADTLPPVITLNGSSSITVVAGQPFSDPGAIAVDACEGAVAVIVGGDTVDTNTVDVYTITYDAEDSDGRPAVQVTRTVNVVAGQPPVITRIGPPSVAVQCGGTYTDQGATAFDPEDGDVSNDIVVTNPVDTNVPAVYTVRYNVVDSSGNPASEVTRTVTVQDTQAPTLSLNGSASITLQCGDSFNDPGASASDTCDGNLDSEVIITGGPVNTSQPGTYTLRYNVADSSGNGAPELTRTVVVQDTQAPTLSLLGNANVVIECGSPYADAGATAIDTCAGNLTGAIQVSGLPINTNQLGLRTITYTVSDPAGNPATPVQRTVLVEDTQAPVITLNGSSIVFVNCGANYTDAGATAADICSGDLSSAIQTTGLPINTSNVGTYQVNYNVTDLAGNPAVTVQRTVVVQDIAPPVITVSGQSTIVVEVGDAFTDPGAFAIDACEGTLAVTVGGDVVDTSVEGTYIITYNATDSTGNAATQQTRTVVVVSGLPPIITLQPTDLTVNFGESAQFTVDAAGLTALDYQWQRNGVDLIDGAKYSGVNTKVLSVLNSANTDEGNYSCRVSSGGASTPSNAAALTVNDPGILQQPLDQLVGPGVNVVFEVLAAGSGVLEYQWQRNGVNLANTGAYTGVDTPTLNIASVDKNLHEGDYRCVVSGGLDGSATSDSATLQIGDPIIVSNPTAVAVNPGGTAQFSVVAAGDETIALVYQWQRNGVNLQNNARISGANTPNLSITNAEENDEGVYTCRVVGQNIVVSQGAFLTVNDPPTISSVEVLPGNGIVSVGGNAAITVIVGGGVTPLTYQWQRNGVNLSDNARIQGSTEATLSIADAEDLDTALYRCVVTNVAGSVVTNAIQIKVGLTITTDLFPTLAAAGGAFSWTVGVNGNNGPLGFQWFKDDGTKAFLPLSDGGGFSGTNSNTLVINPVDFSDAGNYQVVVSDNLDSVPSAIASLTVVEQLDAAGMTALALLGVLMAFVGVATLRRRRA